MKIFEKAMNVMKKPSLLINYLRRFYQRKIILRRVDFNKTYLIDPEVDFSPIAIIKGLKSNIKGIVQVGVHHGQEIQDILKYKNLLKIIGFEPNDEAFSILKNKFNNIKNIKLFQCALSSKKGTGTLWMASNEGQSSSLLEPADHLHIAPDVKFIGKKQINVDILDNYEDIIEEDSLLILDTQGNELDVLYGGKIVLKKFSAIYVEVNRGNNYHGCTQFTDLNYFLECNGFHCSHIRWYTQWGDALYIRNSNKKHFN